MAWRLAALGLLAAALGAFLWQRSDPVLADPAPETARVRRETLDRTVSASGVVRPKVGAEINVGSRVSGIVRSIAVKVGDVVERGELLARLDDTELRADRDQARADLELADAELSLAESAYERARRLADQGIVAASDLDAAARDLEVARARAARERARVSAADIRLGYTTIHAPIRGVVADVSTREGETVAASFAAPTFVTIVDLDRLEVQAYVDETDIGRVFEGQEAAFTVDTYPAARFSARVTAIQPRAEVINGVVNYIVRMDFESGGDEVLRPEMTAQVDLRVDRRAGALTVPRRAVRWEQGAQSVQVQRDGRWVKQTIEAGWRTDLSVEVLAGLAEGETVRMNEE